MSKQVEYVLKLRDQFSKRIGTANNKARSFNKSMGSLIGRFATFAAVGGVLVNSVKKIADFEEAVSNLSAITGAVGKDLDFLSNRAIELGKATTKSSIDTVQAFKLIASAKPELLENAQALAATTKEAITLSEASGLALPDAALALTSALNQFNLGADQSSRLINVLAAGSKFASAEIPDLTASLKEFGGVADTLGVSVEQASAAVETLSAKDLKGQRAGMMLRNVFLKLGSTTDRKLNPKIVGLSTALENLAPIQDDVTKLTKMFGRQNVLAAQTLIKQRRRLDDLTVAMTDTNIAYEQASINTNNLNSDIKKLGSAWEGFILGLNQGEGQISNTLRRSTQFVTEFINKLDFSNKTREERDKSATQTAREALKERLKGIKDEEKAKEAIINRILFEKRMRQEELSEIQELNRLKTTTVGALLLGSEDLRKKNVIVELRKQRLAIINDLTKLIADPKEFEAFFKTKPSLPKGMEGLKKQIEESQGVTKITAAAPKVINLNIQNLTGIETLNTTTFKESVSEAGNMVKNELLIALADMQAVS